METQDTAPASPPPAPVARMPAISEEFRKSMLEFLLDRIRHQNDFPAMAESIATINRIASSEEESIASLSNLIIKDFALTNKLLRLVNSASFAHYGGGNISTVSRAVAILGFDAVKNVALTLLLFDRLKDRKHAAHIQDEFLHALFSGVLAREVSQRAVAQGTEEAFICAMFHHLGRLLVIHYFSAEDREVHRIMAREHVDEDGAALQVLGFSYRELGMAVAHEWCFPEQIVYSMGPLPEGPVEFPATNNDKLRMLAVFANELCETVAHTACADMPAAVRNTVARFEDGLPVTEKQLLDAVDKTMEEVVRYANAIQINLQKTPFGRRISQTEENGDIHNARGCEAVTENEADEFGYQSSEEAGADDGTLDILTAGIVDISDALVDEGPLNKTLHVILETLYRGLGFQQVLLCTVDAYRNTLDARFGFGKDIEALVAAFHFPLAGGADGDVFQIAVARGVDVVIADSHHPHIRARIPAWYQQATEMRAFTLFPLKIRDVPVGLIYAAKEEAGSISFSESERGLLRTLRNQALLAIRQSL